jgi:hypothetical protein
MRRSILAAMLLTFVILAAYAQTSAGIVEITQIIEEEQGISSYIPDDDHPMDTVIIHYHVG